MCGRSTKNSNWKRSFRTFAFVTGLSTIATVRMRKGLSCAMPKKVKRLDCLTSLYAIKTAYIQNRLHFQNPRLVKASANQFMHWWYVSHMVDGEWWYEFRYKGKETFVTSIAGLFLPHEERLRGLEWKEWKRTEKMDALLTRLPLAIIDWYEDCTRGMFGSLESGHHVDKAVEEFFIRCLDGDIRRYERYAKYNEARRNGMSVRVCDRCGRRVMCKWNICTDCDRILTTGVRGQ